MAMAGLTRALSRLVEAVRKLLGALEYLAVVELTTGRRTPGHRPHMHLLVRGPHVPKWWLRERWRLHTKGSFMVDMQPLRSPEHAGEYLIGYNMVRRKQAQLSILAPSYQPGTTDVESVWNSARPLGLAPYA